MDSVLRWVVIVHLLGDPALEICKDCAQLPFKMPVRYSNWSEVEAFAIRGDLNNGSVS